MPYDLSEAFEAIEDELIGSMVRNLKRHQAEESRLGFEWEQWQALQLKALEDYRRRNKKKFPPRFNKLNAQIEEMLRESYTDGRTSQEQKILRQILKGFKPSKRPFGGSAELQGNFFGVNDRKLDALINAVHNDMERAEYAVLRRADDQYRQVIYNAQVYANTGSGTYQKAVDMATRDFLRAGLDCVEYKDGSRHTLEDYADMAIKTANKRAYLQGEGSMRDEWGIPTVIMNKRNCPCPKCAPFVGKVFIDDVWSGGQAVAGTDEGVSPVTGAKYPLMSAAIRQGLYHPRCKDVHSTYFEGISTPPEDSQYTADELDAMAEKYGSEQKQNYCERQEKRYDRMSKYSLDPDNQRMYGARAKAFGEKAETYKNSVKSVENPDESGIMENEDFITFNDGKDVNDFFYYDDEKRGLLSRKNSSYGKWLQSLSYDERSAVEWYAADGYGDINDFLRKKPGWENISPNIQEPIAQIDSAISRFELKNSIVVQRGVGDFYGESIVEDVEWNDLEELIGKTFHDKGFGSSTALVGNNVATSKPFLFEIEIPAGKGRGAYINQLAGQYQDTEYEFLIARNSRFKIVDIIKNNKDFPEQTVVKMRMIVDD